jgi:hypothetical protein
MSIQKHGLSVGIERVENNFFLSLKAIGTLTHQDYELITPLLDAALENVTDPHINVFLDATDLKGWELRAAWDDLKIGLKHGNQFRHIALYGNKNWQEMAAKLGSWFLSGEVKYFEDEAEALAWVNS